MSVFTIVIPVALIVKIAVWAEWRLREVIFNAPMLDACSMLTGYCAAMVYLVALFFAGGQMAVAGPSGIYEIMVLAGVLTLLATPMSVLLIALRPWKKDRS